MKKLICYLLVYIFCQLIPFNAFALVVGYSRISGGGGPSALYTAASDIWNFENNGTAEKDSNHDLTGTVSYGTTSPPQGTYYASFSANSLTLADANADIFEIADGGDYSFTIWYYHTADVGMTILHKTDNQNGIWINTNFSASGYWLRVRHTDNFSNSDADTSVNSDYFVNNAWHIITIAHDGSDTSTAMTIWITQFGQTFGSISNGVQYDMDLEPIANSTDANFSNGSTGNMDQTAQFKGYLVNATEAEALFDGGWE